MSEMTAAAADSADAAASRSEEADTPIELILARFQEVFCYKVPPQASAAGHRAEGVCDRKPKNTISCRAGFRVQVPKITV